ncbi:hypothetical protein [Streptococcus sp. 400_SSPC]|jgi:hypothetical protein|uniref:hypothetical protein n=1 Tax=Streptococcus sp. 400_SSPC TaxID=1579341 RepID=UPI0006609EC0|nr:hypothetical protein [Streptococcus sp. 400_SSPC]
MVNYSDVPRPESVLYFEQNLRRHSNIVYYEKMEDFVYKLVLGNGNIYLVWLTNKYTVSINDVVEKINEGFDALVTISMWNSYTSEAKKYALENQFGLFTFREFMGALNFLDPSQYYTGIDKKDGKRLYGERGYKFD